MKRIAAIGVAVHIVVLAPIGYAGSNTWIAGNGKWESSTNWSLGFAPSVTDLSDLITNAGNNTVTIDATTSVGSPGSMTVSNLAIQAPVGSANTLWLSDSGTNVPLHVLNSLSLGARGALSISNASLRADGTISIAVGSLTLVDGILTATNGIHLQHSSGASLTVSNGTVDSGPIDVGFSTSLTIVGGNTVLSSDLHINGIFGLIEVDGGELVVTNGTIYVDYGQMVVSGGLTLAGIVQVGISNTGTRTDSGERLAILSGGSMLISSNLVIGTCNEEWFYGTVIVDGGNLYVTNATHDATIDLSNGQLILSNGLLQVDRLVVTNSCAQFIHTGGALIAGTVVLDTTLDADGDGIPNAYEQSHGLDPLNAADANSDNDGDGFTNLQEFQAGTDPTNSASAFRILNVVLTNNDMLVSWQAGGGRTNVVQSTSDLTVSFTNISPNIILPSGDDITTNYIDVGAATNAGSRHYHIRLVP